MAAQQRRAFSGAESATEDPAHLIVSALRAVAGVEHRAREAQAEIARLRERAERAEQQLALAQSDASDARDRLDRDGPAILTFSDPQAEARALRLREALKPMDIVGVDLIRLGRAHFGGYVMANVGLRDATFYSCSGFADVSWDFVMASAGGAVFQYNPSDDLPPLQHFRFHRSRQGLGPRTEGDKIALPDALERNGHNGRRDLVLRMDLEGEEWDILESLGRETLESFSQIVIEFHKFWTEDFVRRCDSFEALDRRLACLEALNATHQVIHVHADNFGAAAVVGGALLPDVMEVTYVRREDFAFETCARHFPGALDQPCRAGHCDLQLGHFGLPAL